MAIVRSPTLLPLGLLGLALLPPAGRAAVPMSTFPECGEIDRPDLCPSDLGTDWDVISYIPAEARAEVREAELELGSGVALDRALRTTAGRFDVLIAIGDSGISWSRDDLLNKWYLHTPELPMPQYSDGTEADSHDLDGNGLVNLADYAQDPRVDWSAGADGLAGVLDPSDLITTFSDSIDDDGNGYVDDICGWDFFNDDNDPYHSYEENYGTHGDGVAREAAAEGDGGGGNIGMCPNCAVLPLRVGDTFVTDGTRSAAAIAYAADMGAVAISQAIGAMSSPDIARAAVSWAHDQGMVVVGAAGDENQYHHNFPAVLEDALYVKSIRYNGANEGGAYTYMTTLNCNNYGPRLSLSAPSEACATGATAKITGLAGLIQSAAVEHLGERLTAGELVQILFQTVDDVEMTEDERATYKGYPAAEGWDAFYGYGRVNAARAVEAVAAGKIPPMVRLDSPLWFETIDPLTQPTVEIHARISAPRSSSYTWTLEYGRGEDPRSWTSLASGSETAPVEGVLATMDLSALEVIPVPEAQAAEDVVSRMSRVHGPGVSLRLRVTDAEGNTGEQRKLFHAHPDADLLPGFPIQLSGSAEASPILVDLDEDGVFEVVVPSTSGDVYAFDGQGQAMPGWPVSTADLDRSWVSSRPYSSGGVPTPRESTLSSAAAGDLDGDGQIEIVASTLEGGIWAWHVDGSLVEGFPYRNIGRLPEEFDTQHTYDQGFMGAPALADFDGDGDLEIVAGGLDGRLYVVDGDGSDWGPYPIEPCAPDLCGSYGYRTIASPTLADVDGDGDIDILQGTNEGAQGGNRVVTHLIDGPSGEAHTGWPRLSSGLIAEALLLPLIGEGHPASPAVADLDGDGVLDIFDPIMLGQTDLIGPDGEMTVDLSYLESFYGEGQNTANAPSLVQLATQPAFGDLDGDGVPDPVMGGTSSLWLASLAATFWMDAQHPVAAWSGADGSYLPGWPRQVEDLQFLMAPAIADLSGDGRPEVIYGSAGHLLHAWDVDGVQPDGWPKLTGQWILGSPAVGDITGDGWLDVVVTTREGWLWAWSTQGPADEKVEWASQFHDPRNTGSYGEPLPVQAGPVDADPDPEPKDKRCGGCSAAAAGGGLLFLLPLWVLGRRGRR